MKTKLVIDQSKLLGFKVLGVKVTADPKGKQSVVGAKIGKPGNAAITVGAEIGKSRNTAIIVGAKIGKAGKVPQRL